MYTTAFLQAQNLRVSGISNTSATFQWSHAAKNNVHHIKFKVHHTAALVIVFLCVIYPHVLAVLHIHPYPCHPQLLCSGIQTFTRNGELMEERSSFEHESWSTSKGSESHIATSLVPNSHYTCQMLSVAGNKQSSTKLAPQVTFHTSPGSELCARGVLIQCYSDSLHFRALPSSTSETVSENS